MLVNFCKRPTFLALKWCWVLEEEKRYYEWEGSGQRTGHTGGCMGKDGLMTEYIGLKQTKAFDIPVPIKDRHCGSSYYPV